MAVRVAVATRPRTWSDRLAGRPALRCGPQRLLRSFFDTILRGRSAVSCTNGAGVVAGGIPLPDPHSLDARNAPIGDERRAGVSDHGRSCRRLASHRSEPKSRSQTADTVSLSGGDCVRARSSSREGLSVLVRLIDPARELFRSSHRLGERRTPSWIARIGSTSSPSSHPRWCDVAEAQRSCLSYANSFLRRARVPEHGRMEEDPRVCLFERAISSAAISSKHARKSTPGRICGTRCVVVAQTTFEGAVGLIPVTRSVET